MQQEHEQYMGKSLGGWWKREWLSGVSTLMKTCMASLDMPINVIVRDPDVKAATPMTLSFCVPLMSAASTPTVYRR